MPTPPTNRAERLLDLVSLFLGAERPLSWQELVAAFPGDYGGNPESAQRKFARDRAALTELGIPIRRDEGGDGEPPGYEIDKARYYMRDLDLAPEERAILFLAGSAVLEQPDFPLRSDLAHALNKLNFVQGGPNPTGGRPRLVVHLPFASSTQEPGTLEELGRAVATRKEVELQYRAFGGASTERRVAPYGLAYRRGSWFLVARCYLRNALRIFQVGRIAALTVNPNRPKSPDFQVPDDFDLQGAIGREPWEFAVHPPFEVSLRLSEQIALLARSHFGERAQREVEEGGATRVSLQVSYGEAMVREILRLAPYAESLDPPELRRSVEETALRIEALHRGPGEEPKSFPLDEEGRLLTPRTEARGEGSGKAKQGAPADIQERLRLALFIVPYAVAHPGCTVEELSSAAGLGPDELLEELDFLRMIGRPPFSPADLVDIDVFDGRVQVTLPQGLHRPAPLTPLEAAALDAAASALEVEGGSALAEARAKLRKALLPEGQELFDSVVGRVVVGAGRLSSEDASLIDQAIAERRELSFTYWTAARGEANRRLVRPLERILHQGYWYLHAFCTDRRERRLFRLDRSVDLSLEERRFVPGPDDDGARFQRQSIYEANPHGRVAVVRVKEGAWAEADQLRRLGAIAVKLQEGGGAEAVFPVDGAAWVVATVLSLGGEAELLAPAGIRERTRQAAEAAASRHQGT